MSPKRPPTAHDRDVFVRKTPPRPFAVPEPVEDEEEVTGKHDGDELRELRGRRPTRERLTRLEDKHDGLDEKVDGIDEKVDGIDSRTSRMEGKLDTALAFIADNGKTQRVKISTNGKVLIAIVTAALTTVGTVIVAVLA